MANIKTDELGQFHEYNIYTPARLINLSGEIDEEVAVEFVKNIRLADHVTDKTITVLLNTPGGNVEQGMAIYDAIKECHSTVITHAVGPCWSMGAVIFQAGDKRIISQNATLMIHVGTDEYPEDHSLNLERWIKESKRIGKVADDILYKQIKKKKPRFRRSEFNKLLMFDTIYTAKDSVDMGLADEIAEHVGY